MSVKRRDFLKGAFALSTAGILHLPALASPEKTVDSNRVAMLADTHIRKDREILSRGVYAANHLEENVAQILKLPQLPVATIVCGDCAYVNGQSGDYTMLGKLLLPLREAGIPLYLVLGNHDSRQALWNAFPKQKENLVTIPEEERHVKVLSLPNVNLFLLDTLISTNHTPGLVGEKQLRWLDEKLASLEEKPAVLMAHHDTKGSGNSLQDAKKFAEVIKRHSHAKAYIYGHLHHWERNINREILEVGLPASAHVFVKGHPSGWVDAKFHSNGAKLTLHTVDPKHPQKGEVFELDWKS